MNQHIKELAEQADFFLESDNEIRKLEKFAESIIRECIDTAFHKGHPDLEFLLKHFGVKE